MFEVVAQTSSPQKEVPQRRRVASMARHLVEEIVRSFNRKPRDDVTKDRQAKTES